MMRKTEKISFALFIVLPLLGISQIGGGVVYTSESPYAKLQSLNMQDVKWTGGFWKEEFDMEEQQTLPYMWKLYHNEKITHASQNFEIAAGLMEGKHEGPSFQDGDFYKVFEAMAAVYALNKDQKLADEMDQAITLIGKAQRKDGYINTPVLINDRWNTLTPLQLKAELGFEKYNMGHLMTAACIHHRATGKDNFLAIAKEVADYLYDFYQEASPELARNAICPSHYMGMVEMYRTVRDPRYLELANHLIDIKGTTEDGTDQNQDRVPFKEQTKAMGHAVRANYMYAGVADLYAETGETQLMDNLTSIWDDVVYRKMYITGGCGALYDGVSPDGTSYNPAEVQQIHQAYGRPYQLPNITAHNETCANIGNVLWNWRMLQITGDAKYADVMERTLYNSVLSGISLEGKKFLYTNPLEVSNDLPYDLRWGTEREGYISLSNCCAPNVTRTLAEVANYAYSLSDEGVYVNLYGSNNLNTKTKEGESLAIKQQSQYPWDGDVQLTVNKAPQKEYTLFLRIPEWCENAELFVNGNKTEQQIKPGTYAEIKRSWKTGDQIELKLPMPVQLMQANPLVESNNNLVAVKRGPLVYCLESADLPENTSIQDISLNTSETFSPEELKIEGREITALKANGYLRSKQDWEHQLYRPIDKSKESIVLTLVPYYVWGNRGKGEMKVWLPY